MRQGPPIRRMSRRQATFVVITFLLSALLLSQLAIRRARVDPFSLQPIIRAEGTIVAKDRSAEGHGIVKLEVAVKGAEPMFASWEIPDPYWTSLSPKDRIAVVYQLNNTGTAIRVIECGIVALPDEIR